MYKWVGKNKKKILIQSGAHYIEGIESLRWVSETYFEFEIQKIGVIYLFFCKLREDDVCYLFESLHTYVYIK